MLSGIGNPALLRQFPRPEVRAGQRHDDGERAEAESRSPGSPLFFVA